MRKHSTLLALVCLMTIPSITAATDETVKLVKNVKPAVVLIQTFDANNSPLATGSGFFIDNKGSLITNHHVIEGAYSAIVKTSAGKEYQVTGILAKDTEADIVKLSISTTPKRDIFDEIAPSEPNLKQMDINFPFLKLSTQVPSEGEDIVVVGNPLGLESTVSTGIVSAVRGIPAFGKIIQITAPISPGSSGSPVVNSKGEVIGVATLIMSKGQNLNFAIPSNKVLALKEYSSHILINRYAYVLNKIRQVAENQNSNEYDWKSLGNTCFVFGCYDEAIAAFKHSIALNPDYFLTYQNLGRAYETLGLHKEAIETFKQAIRLEPNYVDSYVTLAEVYDKIGHHNDAMSVYMQEVEMCKQAIRVAPSTQAYESLASAYEKLGRHEDAVTAYMQEVEIYKRLIRKDARPWLISIYYLDLANTYKHLGRTPAAIEACKEALKLDPNNIETTIRAHSDLAESYSELGQYVEAAESYKELIRILPDAPKLHGDLAMVYVKLYRFDAAVAEFKETIRISPDNAYAHYNLGATYLKLGDDASLLKEYKILQSLDKDQANKLFKLIYK